HSHFQASARTRPARAYYAALDQTRRALDGSRELPDAHRGHSSPLAALPINPRSRHAAQSSAKTGKFAPQTDADFGHEPGRHDAGARSSGANPASASQARADGKL